MKKIIALIPARSGSVRVEGKNIRLLNGKPLISYTITKALKSMYISRVIVSTDSEEIAEIAKQYMAEVPFLRPKEISDANSSELEYHSHALEWLRDKENYVPDIIVNLYPTAPFRKTETIDRAVSSFLEESDYDSLRSIRKCAEHPCKMWTLNGKELLPYVQTINSADHTKPYHQLPEIYIQNASIYITKPETIYPNFIQSELAFWP